METENKWIKITLIHLGLILLAAVLFAASFPNPVFQNGVFLFAWFAYVPVLIVIKNNKLFNCVLWGLIYGFFAYLLFNYWLGNFHPLAGIITYSIYSFFFAVVFFLFKISEILFPKRAYLVQWVLFAAYEYLRTLGFMGYPYGITGYSQWKIIPLIQIASITGVWGVSALVTFPSFWLASGFNDYNKKKFTTECTEFHGGRKNSCIKNSGGYTAAILCVLRGLILNYRVPGIIWGAALIAALIFGFINMKDYSSYPKAQIALIQHNTDPWDASKSAAPAQVIEAYRKDLSILMRLSDEALISEPKSQMIVWPETAFIPRIYWHTTYRDDQNSWAIVRDLLGYLSEKDAPFLIGNDDARMDPAINPNSREKYRVDYNAALLFEKGSISETYRKIHLVPFTEHFPYKKQFPFIYDWLEKADTHFWEKGSNETVFEGPGFSFCAPICFEDTFGYLLRKFVRNGAEVIVNLSNDAWSNSLSAQKQHLSMAVFRAVENKRPMVRSTSSGQTCAIDPNGRIIAEALPFKETWLNTSIPLVKKNESTIYTAFGDYMGVCFTIMAALLLISSGIWYTMKKLKGVNKK
jgi:apolipoprotein N-acyltransferase